MARGGSPRPVQKGPLVPHPPSCAQGPQRQGRLARGSAGSRHAARGQGMQPSQQPAGKAPGGNTSWESRTPLPPFSPPSPKRRYFCQKSFAHLFSNSWAGKSLWAGPRDETSSDSPGHVRSKLTPARTPPPRSPGPSGQAPSHPLFALSPCSRCFGIILPPSTHRCRNLENFHATKVLFPERGCKFLLSWGRAEAQHGCMGPPGQPGPNQRGNAGKSLGEIRAGQERVRSQCSH